MSFPWASDKTTGALCKVRGRVPMTSMHEGCGNGLVQKLWFPPEEASSPDFQIALWASVGFLLAIAAFDVD